MSRLERQQAGDAQLLLLFESEFGGLALQVVLDRRPRAKLPAARTRRCSSSWRLGVRVCRSVRLDAEDDILVDRDRERVRTLEDHADRFAQGCRARRLHRECFSEDGDLAGGGDVAVAFVDAVERAQQRGFSAAGGADQRGDDPRLDVDGDVDEGLERAVPEIEFADTDRRRWRVGSVDGGVAGMNSGCRLSAAGASTKFSIQIPAGDFDLRLS